MFTCQNLKSLVNSLGRFSPRQLSSVRNLKMGNWQEEKETFLSMPLDEKRKVYRSKTFTLLEDIPTWPQYAKNTPLGKVIPTKIDSSINSSLNESLRSKVSIFKGDITTLEIDAIVNAANKTLLGGGGVDGAIHRAAGPSLVKECETLHGCETGHAKITGAYKLPSKYVIHTVGPRGEKPGLLQQCYQNCLKIMEEKKLRTIAFPCISTGIYGYPVEPAAHIAAYEVRKHLENHGADVDRVIFCIFMPEDETVYQGILQSYFPLN